MAAIQTIVEWWARAEAGQHSMANAQRLTCRHDDEGDDEGRQARHVALVSAWCGCAAR